jgi:molecular chaperone DnaJ
VAAKNYYRILGIPRSEPAEGVRAAFRALAKRYHPDRAGSGSAERFREIHEAYAVLSDPRRRGQYDTGLSKDERPAAPRTDTWPESFTKARAWAPSTPPRTWGVPRPRANTAPEPLIPRAAATTPIGSRTAGATPIGSRASPVTPLSSRAPHAAPVTPRRILRAEVLMTPAEATDGGVATLTVPQLRPCAACAGAGGFGPLRCEHCAAKGMVTGERTISIRLPPMASPRATYDIVVDELMGLVLQLDVRVA